MGNTEHPADAEDDVLERRLQLLVEVGWVLVSASEAQRLAEEEALLQDWDDKGRQPMQVYGSDAGERIHEVACFDELPILCITNTKPSK